MSCRRAPKPIAEHCRMELNARIFDTGHCDADPYGPNDRYGLATHVTRHCDRTGRPL